MSLLLVLAVAAPARADRIWSAPSPIVDGRQEAIMTRVGPDGTTASVWNSTNVVGDPLYASVDGHPPANLGPSFPFGAQVFAGRHGDAIAVWQRIGTAGSETMVAYSTPDGGWSPPEKVADGAPLAVAMNDRGDAALIAENPEAFCSLSPCIQGAPPRTVELFRPAGGTFGSPADLPLYGERGLALTSTGEALIAIATGRTLSVVSRARDGALSAPMTLATDQFTNRVQLDTDDRGDALATWVTTPLQPGEPQDLRVADRPAGAAWTAPTTIATLDDPLSLATAVGQGGDAVLAWRVKEAVTHPVVAVSGSLSDGVFSAPVEVDREDGRQLSAAVAPDGTAIIATVGFPSSTVRVIRRQGTGPFAPAQVATCATDTWEIGNDYRVADAAGFSDDGTAWLRVDSELLHDAPGTAAAPTCDEPASGAPTPPTYLPEVVMAGQPVTMNANGIVRPDRDLLRATFGFGSTRTSPGTDTSVTHVFATPGRHRWTVATDQRRRFDGADEHHTDAFVADVYGPATLRVVRRAPHALVVRAGAFSDDRRTPVTLLARHGDRTLASRRLRLSATARRVRLPLPAPATRVVLRQPGRAPISRRVPR